MGLNVKDYYLPLISRTNTVKFICWPKVLALLFTSHVYDQFNYFFTSHVYDQFNYFFTSHVYDQFNYFFWLYLD